MSPEELASRIHSGTDWYEFDARSWCEEAAAQLRRLAARVAELEAVGEPVAFVGDVFDEFTLCWIGGGPIAPLIEKHGIKIGDKLFTRPAVPLTDEQVRQGATEYRADDLTDFMLGAAFAEIHHGITGSQT